MAVAIRTEALPGTSLESLVRGYVLTHKTNDCSPHTVAYYGGTLRRFLWYANKHSWPDDVRLLDQWHIREFLGYVATELGRWDKRGNGSESSSRKASHSTVHHYYSVLRSFFHWTVAEGFVAESPVARVKVAKPRRKVIRPYTPEQVRKMLAVCDQDWQRNAKFLGARNKAIVLVLLDTGLRASELDSIKLRDIDVERGWIKVLGKGSKERLVRVGTVAQKALWRYLVHRGNAGDYLWLSEERQPLRTSGIQSSVDRLKERAGISEEGCLHRFRHTFALSFLRADRNPFNLQYLLGHSSLEMVKHYTSTLGMEDALEAHVKASPADLLHLK